MKPIFLVFAFTITALSGSAISSCNLSALPESTTKAVTKTVTESETCYENLFCSRSDSAQAKAAREGYGSCRKVSSKGGGISNFSASYKGVYECTKYVSKKLGRKERVRAQCKVLLNCSINQTGNTSVILDMINRLQCEKHL